MVLRKVIFSIPIYFCSHADFSKRIERKKKEFDAKQKCSYAFKRYGIVQEFRTIERSWEYNQIIGWIEIYVNGTTLKADYWLIDASRITFNASRKCFEYRSKLADVSITYNKSNEEIVEDIKNFFRACQKGTYSKKFKKYYIDIAQLYEWLGFLDIKALIQRINSQKCILMS